MQNKESFSAITGAAAPLAGRFLAKDKCGDLAAKRS